MVEGKRSVIYAESNSQLAFAVNFAIDGDAVGYHEMVNVVSIEDLKRQLDELQKSGQIILIMTATNLNGVDTSQMVEWLKKSEKTKDIPVVVFDMLVDKETERRFRDAGADGLIRQEIMYQEGDTTTNHIETEIKSYVTRI